MKKGLWILVALNLASSGLALAQEKKESGARNRTTEVNFEDDTIEGDLSKPDGEYVEALKRVKHSNLIRIREDFKEEVMASVGEL